MAAVSEVRNLPGSDPGERLAHAVATTSEVLLYTVPASNTVRKTLGSLKVVNVSVAAATITFKIVQPGDNNDSTVIEDKRNVDPLMSTWLEIGRKVVGGTQVYIQASANTALVCHLYGEPSAT